MITEQQTPLVLALAGVENLIVENPQQAEKKVLRIFARSKTLHDARAQLIATMQLARIAWHLTQYEKGIVLCKRVETLLLPEFESEYLSELYHIYAQQYWGLERFRSAHHFWNLAMEKSLVHNQLSLQIESLIGVGNIWRVNQEIELSYSALSLAMTLAEQYDYNILAGKSAILLSWSLSALKQYALMLEVLAKAEVFLCAHTDFAWHAEIKDLQSIALANLGRLDEAELVAKEANRMAIDNYAHWVAAHAPISRARVALLLKKHDQARQYLDLAETVALRFNQLELLSELYWLRFELEQQQQDAQKSLHYFKTYRHFSVKLLRSRSVALGKDECQLSIDILNYKAELLIGRLEAGAFNASEGGFPAFREASIWLYACQRAQPAENMFVFILEFNNEKELIAILPLVHALCEHGELITRFKKSRLGILFNLKPEQNAKMLVALKGLLSVYPWWRSDSLAENQTVCCFPVTDFLKKSGHYLDKTEGDAS